MKKLLLVVDVQSCFINNYTIEVRNNIEKLLKERQYDFVVFGKFKNNISSPFYNKLKYKKCITNEETEIVLNTENCKVIERCKYSLYTDELKSYIKDNNITEIYICGFDTDACIYKTALDLFENNYNVFVLKEYCGSSGGYKLHEVGLTLLNRQLGKDSII
jgi:nicotinamidase-related amidase